MKIQFKIFLLCYTVLSKHSYDRVVDLGGGSTICHVTESLNLPLRNFWKAPIAPKHCVNLKISAMHIFRKNYCVVSFLISVTPIFRISENKVIKIRFCSTLQDFDLCALPGPSNSAYENVILLVLWTVLRIVK